MSETFTYVFQDGTGQDVISVQVATPTTSTPFGSGYSITGISGAIDGKLITGESGAGGSGQFDKYNLTFDNTIYPSTTSGEGGHSYDGIDGLGFEFTVGSDLYAIREVGTGSSLVLYDETTKTSKSLTVSATSAPCYCPGTLILTTRGEVPVEQLRVGDMVRAASGAARPVRWIGQRFFAGRFLAANPAMQPVRFRAGSLGGGLPRRDLLVSPDHAMFLDGVLVPARHLVNGATIVQERGLDRVEYFHVELDGHDVILAEGAFSESFVDDDSRFMFHNAAEWEQLYPGRPRVKAVFCAPRVETGPQLEAIRQRLDALADRVAQAA